MKEVQGPKMAAEVVVPVAPVPSVVDSELLLLQGGRAEGAGVVAPSLATAHHPQPGWRPASQYFERCCLERMAVEVEEVVSVLGLAEAAVLRKAAEAEVLVGPKGLQVPTPKEAEVARRVPEAELRAELKASSKMVSESLVGEEVSCRLAGEGPLKTPRRGVSERLTLLSSSGSR